MFKIGFYDYDEFMYMLDDTGEELVFCDMDDAILHLIELEKKVSHY